MNYTLVLKELEKASLFELFRLKSAISDLLDDPVRLLAIKRQLQVGTDITYFDTQKNCLIPAHLEAVRKTRASVRDLETGKLWTVPLYMINIEGATTDIEPHSRGVDRLSLRVGDRVGFEGRAGEDVFGTVIKLNPKRAKVETDQGIWNVSYSFLFTVLEGEQGNEQYLIPKS